MKHYRIFLASTALVLASLACQALTGSGNNNNVPNSENSGKQQSTAQPTEPSADSTNSNPTINTNFPMTSDAFNAMELGEDSILYYTKLSADEVMQLYRDELTKRGYTERKDTTIVSDTTFSMVFDGDPSGKALVIQSVDLGDGTRTVNVRLEGV